MCFWNPQTEIIQLAQNRIAPKQTQQTVVQRREENIAEGNQMFASMK